MTQPPDDALGLAIHLHGLLTDKSITNRSCEGSLPENQNFQQIVNLLESCDLLVAEVAAQRKIEFSFPSNFFYNIDDFLAAPSRRISSPSEFFIADIEYRFDGDKTNAPTIFKNYFQAVELFKALKSVAYEIPKGNDIELIFINNEKIHLTSKYDQNHLKPLDNLPSFQDDFISSQTHKEQKSTIIKTAITTLFNQRELIEFSEVISRFEEFFLQINNSYQLYVSEFSFLKIKAEVEKEKLEFITKLNKVFSDIQSQLLAIPAALILIGGQMEVTTYWSIKNILIWLGALSFSLLMNLLIRNQTHTLNAIKTEIDQQKDIIKTKHATVADRFLGIYEQLERRYIHQKRLIKTIDGLVAFSLIISTSILIYYSATNEIAYRTFYITTAISTYFFIAYVSTSPIVKLFKVKSLAGLNQ